MPLTVLNYKPSVTGKAIDSKVKQKKNLDPKTYQGWFVWQPAFESFYQDLMTTMCQSIDTYLSAMQVQFQPGIMATPVFTPMMPPPLIALATPSAMAVDGQIKAQCSAPSNQKPILMTYGQKIWWEFLKQICIDIIPLFSVSVSTKIMAGVVLVPAGVMAPPVTTTFAPAPALLNVPFVSAQLQGLLQGFLNPGAVQPFSAQIDSKIKSQCSSTSGKKNELDMMGEKIWQSFLDIFCPYLKTSFETSIKMFATAPGLNWFVPPGLPGLPIIPPGIPSIGGTLPGKNL